MRRLALLGCALVGLACSRHDLVDYAMTSAHRPSASPLVLPGGALVLAGDLHCHVAPPDDPTDVTRGLERTIELARREKLDFVVFTPHVGARFYLDAEARGLVADGQRALVKAIAAADAGGLVMIPGFEYTDHQYGHVGASFADLDAVLADVPVPEAKVDPARFFERWVARGGLLSIHHPFVTPLPGSSFAMAKVDLSWRPFTQKGPFPPEIEAVTRLAHGLEVFNLTATHLRDRYLLGDGEASLRASFAGLDGEVRRQRRRLAAFGGTDSHEDHLRASTFVVAAARTRLAIHQGLELGRTCVRDPHACSFTITASDGRVARVGDALEGVSAVSVSIDGDDAEVFVDGKARPKAGVIDVPSTCTVLRARAGKGWSSPVYVNCGL